MKALTVLLIGLLLWPSVAWAQSPAPTLLEQGRAEVRRAAATRDIPLVVVESRMEHPLIFWTGVGVLALGVVTMVGAVSWARDSDLSNEFQNVRIGTDLAPCGTEFDETRLPIAECKTNTGMFWLGTGLTAVGGGMMIFGGTQVEKVVPRRYPSISATVRF